MPRRALPAAGQSEGPGGQDRSRQEGPSYSACQSFQMCALLQGEREILSTPITSAIGSLYLVCEATVMLNRWVSGSKPLLFWNQTFQGHGIELCTASEVQTTQ